VCAGGGFAEVEAGSERRLSRVWHHLWKRNWQQFCMLLQNHSDHFQAQIAPLVCCARVLCAARDSCTPVVTCSLGW
jgi:hypothetical protein